jgi:DNA-binding transcriptional regulator/RsmH inhibitor MraZ
MIYHKKLDPKGRIRIPHDFRDLLNDNILYLSKQFLKDGIFPYISISELDQGEIVVIDKYGRTNPIPNDALKFIGMKKDPKNSQEIVLATLYSPNYEIDIWNPEIWNEVDKELNKKDKFTKTLDF